MAVCLDAERLLHLRRLGLCNRLRMNGIEFADRHNRRDAADWRIPDRRSGSSGFAGTASADFETAGGSVSVRAADSGAASTVSGYSGDGYGSGGAAGSDSRPIDIRLRICRAKTIRVVCFADNERRRGVDALGMSGSASEG
jgi:hypothetical protein